MFVLETRYLVIKSFKMPRGRSAALTAKAAKNIQSSSEEVPESFVTPDLSRFSYEKKLPVKIAFEKDFPEKQLWQPPKWREFLVNLRIMRANNEAPVDTMGCDQIMDPEAPPEVRRYQTLIALMLSSQTKDQVTSAAMERLRGRGLTVDNVLSITDEELAKLIYPVGFYKTKVKYIKKTTQTLKEQYNSDIPDTVEKLCKLTGVGPKMAHICMKTAWNKVTGIGVDTHVHRISNRIGWVKKTTTTPEDTRKALESWIPFEVWSEVNHLLVGFGQTICSPISPSCHECLNRDICPYGISNKKTPTKKSPIKIKAELKQNDINTEMISTFKSELQSPNKKESKLSIKKEISPKSLTIESKKIQKKVSPRKAKVTSTNAVINLHDNIIIGATQDNTEALEKMNSIPNIIVQSAEGDIITESPVDKILPRKRKDMPKIPGSSTVPLTLSTEKSPKQRKVTQKKKIENVSANVENEKGNYDEIYNFEYKTLDKATTDKVSPRRRKLTTKKEESTKDNISDTSINDHKKTTRQRKVMPK